MGNSSAKSKCDVCDQWFMSHKQLAQHRIATDHQPRKRLVDSKYHRRAVADSDNGESDVKA